MPRSTRLRDRRWGAVGVIVLLVLLVLYGMPGVAAQSGDAWAGCRDRVIGALEAAGLRDFGDAGAYTGATGTAALEAVIAQCGYHPEQVERALCDDLFQQVYQPCREDGFEDLSMAATSWVLIFDPDGPFVERLRRVCTQAAPVSRAVFGRLVCRE